MKTLEMEIALSGYLDYRRNLVVFNPSWGLYVGGKIMHECDILMLSQVGYATEIEIKVSKADLLKDDKKEHGHEHPYIKSLWFAVPEKLAETALTVIPQRAGLYSVKKVHIKNEWHDYYRYKITPIKKPATSKTAPKWSDGDRYQLARLGAIRACALKQKLYDVSKK